MRKGSKTKRFRGGALGQSYTLGAPIIPGVDTGISFAPTSSCMASVRPGMLPPTVGVGLPGMGGGGRKGGKNSNKNNGNSHKKTTTTRTTTTTTTTPTTTTTTPMESTTTTPMETTTTYTTVSTTTPIESTTTPGMAGGTRRRYRWRGGDNGEVANNSGMDPAVNGEVANNSGMKKMVNGEVANNSGMKKMVNGEVANNSGMKNTINEEVSNNSGTEPEVNGEVSNNSGMDAAVNEEVVNNSAMEPAAIEICGNLGKPSADGNTRIYTRDECEGTLNGIWHANGDCTKVEGGSYSYDCRYLNSLPDPQPPAANGEVANNSGMKKRANGEVSNNSGMEPAVNSQNGGRYTADLSPLTGAAPWAGGIPGVIKIPCENSATTHNTLNTGTMIQSGGVGGVDSARYMVPTAGYSNTPSSWVGVTGSPYMLQTPYSAGAMNPACLTTGGGRRMQRKGKSKKSRRKVRKSRKIRDRKTRR